MLAFAHKTWIGQQARAQLVTKQLKSEGTWFSVQALNSPAVQLDAMQLFLTEDTQSKK